MNEPQWRDGKDSGVKLASVSIQELHRSILLETERHLREGVDVSELDGMTAIRSFDHVVALDQTGARARRLRSEIEEAARRARAARKLATDEALRDDAAAADSASAYLDDARRHLSQQRRLERELEDAEQPSQSRCSLPDEFDSECDLLLQSLAAVFSPEGTISITEAAALHGVIDDFRFTDLEERPTELRWTMYLRLLAEGGVLRAGPISGTVTRHGREITPAEFDAFQRDTDLLNPAARSEAINRLHRAGLSRHLANAAVRCPFPELIAAIDGTEPDWDDHSDAFNSAAFNSHVRAVYRSDMSWGRAYSVPNRARQAITDLVAALDGSARSDQAHHAGPTIGLKRTDPSRLSTIIRDSHSPPWHPPVSRSGPWADEPDGIYNMLHSIICEVCDRPATAVVRVPEVPGSLLCRQCGRPPAQPDLVFPSCYTTLALPPAIISDRLLSELRVLEAPTRKSRERKRNSKPRREVPYTSKRPIPQQ